MGNCELGLCISILFCIINLGFSTTDPNDATVLSDFRKGLDNPELLKWPSNENDPCGPPLWPHVFCSKGRVTQIQVASFGLKGTLPQSLNQLTKLQRLGLQNNHFKGNLPSFSGLLELESAYLDSNEFDTIPSDFFHGLNSVRVLALDDNPFNATSGWSLPDELQNSVQLGNFSCSRCNIVGELPNFFGKFPSLTTLELSYNRLSGPIPSSLEGSTLKNLWLNDQEGGGMRGSIDIIATMSSLIKVWLHGNQFSGSIPENIGDLTSLKELNLNRNQLVGRIPPSLASMDLDKLDLNNNDFVGSIPKFKTRNVTFASNSFCDSNPDVLCSPQVDALLEFLHFLNYPLDIVSQWSGNDPCKGPWIGLLCNSKGEIMTINIQNHNLNGTLSPSLADLGSLEKIYLDGNNIHGQVPADLTQLKLLRLLDLTGNNFEPPLPKFDDSVKVILNGNPLFNGNRTKESPSPSTSMSTNDTSSSGESTKSTSSGSENAETSNHRRSIITEVLAIAIGCIFMIILLIIFAVYHYKKKKTKGEAKAPNTAVVSRNDASDPHNMIKIAVLDDTPHSLESESVKSNVAETGNLLVSFHVLRNVTNNFDSENELGRGGFGAVYKGVFQDGSHIAVKRMEGGVITTKALDEFRSEIAVLSSVRHRHLVSLSGYSVEGNERLLVYEYMPQGALSRHLFNWESLNLDPLSWTRRLRIALDVARGIEYLHTFAHQSFIHRDLKSSNILLDDDFRAKISDFGLVKLAPDKGRSIATRLAGTFGYLAPEYAVTGKVTTKIDVFSFGVVLMELLTGLVALDEQRSDENRYLAEWFWQIKADKEKLLSAIDPALSVREDTLEGIQKIAELAGFCTSRDPNHRPDMGYVVNVLSPLVQNWKPFDGETDEEFGIDYNLPLPEMIKDWKESETRSTSGVSFEESKGSSPDRPDSIKETFGSADAR